MISSNLISQSHDKLYISYCYIYISVYDVSQHAKVKSGDWTKDQAFAEFLKTFDSPNNPDGEVCNKNMIMKKIHREKSIPMIALWCPAFSNHG